MGGHAHLQSSQKLCITFGYNDWGIRALIFTHQRMRSMFGLLNSLHCIDNTCEGVQLVMDMIRMNVEEGPIV